MAIDLVGVELDSYFRNFMPPISFKFGDHRTYASGGITFFLSGFSFTNIHNLQDSGVKNMLSLKLLLTTSTRFTDT